MAYKRRRRFKKFIKKYKGKRAVYKLWKAVKRISPEVKFYDWAEIVDSQSSSAAFFDNGAGVSAKNYYMTGKNNGSTDIMALNSIEVGNTNVTRVGNKIRMLSIEINVWAKNKTSGSSNIVQFDLWLDKYPQATAITKTGLYDLLWATPVQGTASIPNVSGDISSIYVLSQRNRYNAGRFKQLCSGTFDLDGGHGEYNNFCFKKKLGIVTQYKSGNGSDCEYAQIQRNALFITMMPSGPVTYGVTCNINTRILYTDA